VRIEVNAGVHSVELSTVANAEGKLIAWELWQHGPYTELMCVAKAYSVDLASEPLVYSPYYMIDGAYGRRPF